MLLRDRLEEIGVAQAEHDDQNQPPDEPPMGATDALLEKAESGLDPDEWRTSKIVKHRKVTDADVVREKAHVAALEQDRQKKVRDYQAKEDAKQKRFDKMNKKAK